GTSCPDEGGGQTEAEERERVSELRGPGWSLPDTRGRTWRRNSSPTSSRIGRGSRLAAAKDAYPSSLKRGKGPGSACRTAGAKVAIERLAFGGHRLAATLEEMVGQ